ncbi:MAG: class I SAM-dependent methyltransferase [Rhodospirillales bacterium]|nr:class I SAM-dependent methyltransferase [Rhodospirillales bacterium]
MEHRRHGDVIREMLDLDGKTVLDIGCGDGSLSRLLARAGAHVTGLECNLPQLQRAKESEPVADETYLEGIGEDQPVEDASVDIAIFFNSFHHIDPANMGAALAETQRTLKPGGQLLIIEPLAEGPQYQLTRMIDDEFEVRALAYETIKAGRDYGFKEKTEYGYIFNNIHKSLDKFRERSCRVDPARADIFEEHGATIRQTFEEFGKPVETGFAFEQPMRANLLEKI